MLQVYIPEALAAICADCNGIFPITVQKCPGCGSKQYVPFKPKEGNHDQEA